MRYCLALDLKENPELIEEYKRCHQRIWPEIAESIRSAGILGMEIWNTGNRMFMIMEVSEGFSFDKKAELDRNNPKVAEWEELMWRFQKPLPNALPGQKWILTEKIFDLKDQVF